MKRVLVVFAIVVLCMTAFSHAAMKVEASFDNETKVLTVTFEHPVRNADEHFIYEIEVKVNKKEVIKQEITKQESEEGGEFQYKLIDLKSGDKIKVITKCNKGGKKSETITIE